MKFIEFAEQLSATIGEHHLPLNATWRKATDIVRDDAIHYPLAQQIICRIYKENGCSNPNDQEGLGAVLDALGEVGQELQKQKTTDVEGLQLLNDIGRVSLDLLEHQAVEIQR